MASPRTVRFSALVAVSAVAAISLLNIPWLVSAWAEPGRNSHGNTGTPAGPAFLSDLLKGYDPGTQYLADYKMKEEWIDIRYSPDNVRFDSDGMTLELMPTRGEVPFLGSEFQRTGNYGYGRYEAVIRASNAPGVVSSFFVYTGEYWNDPHDEIDFEFVGRTPREVHLNYFKNNKDDAVDIPLWFDASADFHLYAFEWAPDSIRWYVDGVKIREVTLATPGPGIPTTTGRVVANIWAGVGPATHWTGESRFRLARATYRCMSHVPIGKTGSQCSDTFTPPPR